MMTEEDVMLRGTSAGDAGVGPRVVSWAPSHITMNHPESSHTHTITIVVAKSRGLKVDKVQ